VEDPALAISHVLENCDNFTLVLLGLEGRRFVASAKRAKI